MNDKSWTRWIMQTARDWEDIQFMVKETGVAPVDHDHKRLAQYILELNGLINQLNGGFTLELMEKQKKLLNQIYDYTAAHFSREEKLLEKYKIRGLDEQQKEHQHILNMIEKQLFQFSTGRISTGQKLRIHLLEWVVRHINETDYKVFRLDNMASKVAAIDDWQDISNFIRSVHIPSIDHDHRILTEKIIALGKQIKAYKTSGSKEDRESMMEELQETRGFTSQHFNNEMQILHSYPIPGEEEQKEQHDYFLQFLDSQYESLQEGLEENLNQLEIQLMTWWIRHINICDYNTFRKSNWVEGLLSNAQNPKDVVWLISKTGLSMVDSDHAHFIELLFKCNHLFHGDVTGESLPKAMEELQMLHEYARGHFLREEELMHQNYPEHLDHHRNEHIAILHRLNQQYEFLKKNMIDFSPQFKKRLLQLWINHTNGTDLETFGVSYDG